ncbi:MAG: triple tyrosine motif-containing protein, partial [Pseudomonadota bacterium]
PDPQIGSYYGQLYQLDPSTGATRTYELGEGAGIYPLDVAADGQLWLLANYQGLFRMDPTDADATPERVLGADTIGREFFTDIEVTRYGDSDVVWFSSLQGGLFQWRDGQFTTLVDPLDLDEKTVFSLQPLPDGTVAFTTSRGVYRLDPATQAMDYYTALDGFVALEGKVHSRYMDSDDTLWIGTTSGVTAMDTAVPMSGGGAPRTLIVRRTVNGEVLVGDDATPTTAQRGRVMIEYAAVSTRRPDGIEFSYRLQGQDENFSAPTNTRSIEFSSLAPGDYVFEVRSRFPAGEWSEPQRWAFLVPTPYYQTTRFLVLALGLGAAVAWGIVQLRLRSVANLNKRLRQQVLERTQSIDQQRSELETINEQLSSEIEERQKAEAEAAQARQEQNRDAALQMGQYAIDGA